MITTQSTPFSSPVLLRLGPEQGHRHHPGPETFLIFLFLSPLNSINPLSLKVLPAPGVRRLTLAPPSPHHGRAGGGGGGEEGDGGGEGSREGRRESTLSFSLAVPQAPHQHPRRRESIAPCREACALVR